MSSRNVLLVALEPVAEDELKRAIERRKRDADVDVHVVAPASNIGTFKWLAGDEDEARAEAEELADRAAQAVDAEVETEVGDRDPLLAVEDALVEFPADEILLAGHADEKDEAALRQIRAADLAARRRRRDSERGAVRPRGGRSRARARSASRNALRDPRRGRRHPRGCDRANQRDRFHRLLPRLSEVSSVPGASLSACMPSGTVLRRTARSAGRRSAARGGGRSPQPAREARCAWRDSNPRPAA